MPFACDDKQTLIAYLYGELEPAERKAVDDHLSTCADCSAEVMALGDARSQIGLWAAPDVELDFAIVRKTALPAANVLRPARWWNTVPVWAQAAAAILVLAVGAAIANVQVRSGPDGVTVSTGWMSFDSNTANVARGVRAQDTQPDESWKPALIALEQQLRNEIRSTSELGPTRVAARGPADEATVRRVEQMLAEAERRHSQELAVRFVEFTRDMNMQRRADMMKIGQGFDEYNRQLVGQRQLINNAIRVSSTPQQ
ncbi:MAG TPA: zf-HC2 domain-containing protein [Vicinamibacterales bacterium]